MPRSLRWRYAAIAALLHLVLLSSLVAIDYLFPGGHPSLGSILMIWIELPLFFLVMAFEPRSIPFPWPEAISPQIAGLVFWYGGGTVVYSIVGYLVGVLVEKIRLRRATA